MKRTAANAQLARVAHVVSNSPNLWEDVPLEIRVLVREILAQMANAGDASANIALIFLDLLNRDLNKEWKPLHKIVPEHSLAEEVYADLFTAAMKHKLTEALEILVAKARHPATPTLRLSEGGAQLSPAQLSYALGRAAGRHGAIPTKLAQRGSKRPTNMEDDEKDAKYLQWLRVVGLPNSYDNANFWNGVRRSLVEMVGVLEKSAREMEAMETLKELGRHLFPDENPDTVLFAASTCNFTVLKFMANESYFAMSAYATEIAYSAALGDRWDIIDWLFDDPAVWADDSIVWNVFSGAILGHHLTILEAAIKKWPQFLATRGSELYLHARFDTLDIMEWLLQKGARFPREVAFPFTTIDVVRWFREHNATISSRMYQNVESTGQLEAMDKLAELNVPLPPNSGLIALRDKTFDQILGFLNWYSSHGVKIHFNMKSQIDRAVHLTANEKAELNRVIANKPPTVIDHSD